MSRPIPTMTAEELGKWEMSMLIWPAPPKPRCEPVKREAKPRSRLLACGICEHSFTTHWRNRCRSCDCPGYVMGELMIADYVRRFHGDYTDEDAGIAMIRGRHSA